MFAKCETERSLANGRNSAHNQSRNQLNRVQSEQVFGTTSTLVDRSKRPDAMTYIMESTTMADQIKQKAIKSVFRNNQNAPFNAKSERFSVPKAQQQSNSYLNPF